MWNRGRRFNPSRRCDASHLDRKQAEGRLRSAEQSLSCGRFDQAVRQALDLVAAGASDLSHLNRLGDLLVRADRIAPGVALFERVGRAYAADGFWAKAIAIYKKILRYDPWRSDIQAQLAFLYQRSGLPTGAGSS